MLGTSSRICSLVQRARTVIRMTGLKRDRGTISGETG